MFSTAIQVNDNSPNLSDQNNSRVMDDFINDLEAGISYNPPRNSNKKMKKRKQLDALLKSRSSSSRSNRQNNRLSNEFLLSSEDEDFLSNKKNSTKIPSTRYRSWCSYTRHIISFCLVCIFMIVCVGLAYANIELKTEVQNLSSRVTEIEKRFSNFEINRMLSTIDQIKHRLNLIERWNVSYVYNRLQKLQRDFHQIKQNRPTTETLSNDDNDVDISSKLDNIEQKSVKFSQVADELDKLSRDADDELKSDANQETTTFDKNLIEHLLEQEQRINNKKDSNELSKALISFNETLYGNSIRWTNELKSLRSEIINLNQSARIEELSVYFQKLTNLVHNSSNKIEATITRFQSDLLKLQNEVDKCGCSSATDISSSSSTLINTASVSPDLNQLTKTDSNNTIDIAQIVNQHSSMTN